MHQELLLICTYIHKYNQDSHSCTLPHPISVRFIPIFTASCKYTHMLSLSHSLCISLLSQTHMYTHRCLRERERKPTELEKRLSQDERLHTHCLHAEPLPTPSRDSAYCSRGLCLADTLQLASLPTPIIAATHLHPFLSFNPFLSPSLSMEL